MPSNVRYLIDSDVLISSKTLYYRPAFCEAFWAWILLGHAAGISRWAAGGPFHQAAKDKFLSARSADAWLVALASSEGDCVIVTNEVSAPQSKKDIKLPDAAAVAGVNTLPLFELLQQFAEGTFSFKG
jgi:hypothetical protein